MLVGNIRLGPGNLKVYNGSYICTAQNVIPKITFKVKTWYATYGDYGYQIQTHITDIWSNVKLSSSVSIRAYSSFDTPSGGVSERYASHSMPANTLYENTDVYTYWDTGSYTVGYSKVFVGVDIEGIEEGGWWEGPKYTRSEAEHAPAPEEYLYTISFTKFG